MEVRTGPRALAAVVAVLAAIGVQVTWLFFVNSTTGQRLDRLAFESARHGQARMWDLLGPALNVVSVAFVLLAVAVLVFVAAVRKRWFLALQVVVMVLGANATTQLLKDVIFSRPNLLPGWTGANSLPSGHTTVAASVTMALLLVCPRLWRPAVAVVGVGWTVVTGVATLVGQWHRPSDIVAAVLVSLAWAAGACALTTTKTLDGDLSDRAPGPRRAANPTGWTAAALIVVAVATGAMAILALIDLGTAAEHPPFEGGITAYAGGVAGFVSVAAAAFAALLILRQATARPAYLAADVVAQNSAPYASLR